MPAALQFWVCFRGVPLLLWAIQFFAFVGNALGRLLEFSPATTISKVNLSEAWIKILVADFVGVPSKLEVESPMGRCVISTLYGSAYFGDHRSWEF